MRVFFKKKKGKFVQINEVLRKLFFADFNQFPIMLCARRNGIFIHNYSHALQVINLKNDKPTLLPLLYYLPVLFVLFRDSNSNSMSSRLISAVCRLCRCSVASKVSGAMLIIIKVRERSQAVVNQSSAGKFFFPLTRLDSCKSSRNPLTTALRPLPS